MFFHGFSLRVFEESLLRKIVRTEETWNGELLEKAHKELHTVHFLYLNTLKVFMICGQGAESVCWVRLVNTVCAPPSSFIFPYFLTQQVSRYGNWTVIFPVYSVHVDKIKEDGMHTKFWLKYWREEITWKTKGGCDDNIRMNLRQMRCGALSFVNAR